MRAQAFIREQSGRHFDPNLVEAIQGCFEQIEKYFEQSKIISDAPKREELHSKQGQSRAAGPD